LRQAIPDCKEIFRRGLLSKDCVHCDVLGAARQRVALCKIIGGVEKYFALAIYFVARHETKRDSSLRSE